MKRKISIVLFLFLLCQFVSGCSGLNKVKEFMDKGNFYEKNGISYGFRTKEKSFQIYNGEKFEDFYITGVNIGAGEPNAFPGELLISEEDYLTWFEQIADMGANSVRVYTVLKPAFYNAFYEYNTSHDKKLYLFQGCWYEEDAILESEDAYSSMEQVKTDLKDLVEIIHGSAYIGEKTGHGFGEYTRDISKWVAGWILGIESEQTLVDGTQNAHPEKKSYTGNYLSCDNVGAYEVFWCKIGDYVLSYEAKQYKMQRPISYSNWPTTDVFEHPNEPLAMEDGVSLTVEDIKPTEQFSCGLFASYHVYPYYPNFLFKEEPYISYKGADGKVNPYRCYIQQLADYHTVPLVIAEFGVPVSRGVAHVNPVTGFNQGGHTDTEQGEMLLSMYRDIKEAGCAGAIIFTWQDEWFKKNWNTEQSSDSNQRAYWNDVQNCEQHFGLLEFVSDELKEPVMLDADASEWESVASLYEDKDVTMKVTHDSTYLYVLLQGEHMDYETGKTCLYFDINPQVGCSTYRGTKLKADADFVLDIHGKDETRMMVENSSDTYMRAMDGQSLDGLDLGESKKDTFHREYMVVDRGLYYPQTKEKTKPKLWETGLMRFASNNEKEAEYDYLADFYYKQGIFEIRIPWGILGFAAPNCKEINTPYLDDVGQSVMEIENMKIGFCVDGSSKKMVSYDWEGWQSAKYTQRLRRSYFMLQEEMKK